jgi:aminoglycoside/choline kinase family phosphotransferase
MSESALEALVKRAFGVALESAAMPGGASARRYFRLNLGDGQTAVAMFVPENGRPEEVHKVHHAPRWPFLEVRDLLAERGVDVPKVLAEDIDNGWLVIEDLGDETLAKWLLERPGERVGLYKKAVEDCARAQSVLRTLPAGSFLDARLFDFEVVRWEIEHFREWALDARDKPLASEDVDAWNHLADRFAHRVADLPRGFVHRDYQSRNLMVVDGKRLVWIDFQDALLGPRVYDLVALLNDSVQDFDRAFVEARLRDFAAATGCEYGELPSEFDLVTVQRKMKDAGRFVFVDRQKGNSRFLEFVTPTIKKMGGALKRLAPQDAEMAQLLAILERTLGTEID